MDSIIAKYLFEKDVLYKNEVFLKKTIEKPIQTKLVETEVVRPPKPAENSVKIKEVELIKPLVQTTPLLLNHKILILTNSISEADKMFLAKVLNAVGLSLEQIDLIELNTIKNIDYQAFISKKITNKFISFGVGFSRLGWNLVLAPYQIKTIEGVNFLLADELKNIAENQTLKKSLWEGLKKMFG